MMIKLFGLLTVVAPIALGPIAAPVQAQLPALFSQLGLTPTQQTAIADGHPVVKVLPWGTPSEVFVFGAVYINGSPAAYLKAARNVAKFAGTEGYLGIGELPAAATAADLRGLTLDPDDLKALKSCKEGACDVQLPTSSITAFQNAVNWSQPDAAAQANTLARKMMIDLLGAYQRGGNAELGVYRDKDHPARVAEQFETMVGRSATLPDMLPELRQYLLEYPGADLPGGDSFFFWEKVDFGMKPTIRLNHGITYHVADQRGDVSAVAIKQLYASHYFHTALDVSICVSDATRPERHGFYLLTLKSSEQDGLTGMKGSMLRKVVVDKTRSSLEKTLGAIKQNLERASGTKP